MSKTVWRALGAIAVLAFWPEGGLLAQAAPSPAQATGQPLSDFADLPLDKLAEIPIETVSGASRYDQKVTQAPASVSVVTADAIKKLGYRTLAEVLQSVSGLYASSDRNYSYLGIRGFLRPGDYNSRVLLLVDGHRLNDNLYDQALLGTEGSLDVDLIERVEVIRGPSSSIYGDNAFFGVINVTTRRGGQLNGVEASVEAGSFDTYKGRFTAGTKFTNEVELLVSGSWYDSAGDTRLYYPEFDTLTNHFGIARNSDGDRSQSYFTTLSWKDFSLSGGWSNREKQVPTASYGTVFDSRREETVDQRGYLDLRLGHQFSEDTRLTAQVSYDLASYQGTYPYYSPNPPTATSPAPVVMNYDEGDGQWAGTSAQLMQRLFDKHTILFGMEYRENFQQEQQNFYNDPTLPRVHIDQNSRNIGVYGQAEILLLKELTFNGGLRYDYYDTFGGTANPRLGLIYNPWQQTTFKALYGEAFRAPNSFELDYYVPGFNASNPNLSPETIRTYELVYDQYLPAHFRASVSAYYNQIHDLISEEVDPMGQLYFANVDRVDAKGLEFEVEHKSSAGLLARLSYTCQRADDVLLDQELTNSPRHQAKLSLIVPVWRDRIFTGVELLGTSPVRTLAGQQADGYFIANWTVFSQQLLKGLEASFTLYNLFDTRYGYPGGDELRQDIIQQDGRTFRIKLTYRF